MEGQAAAVPTITAATTTRTKAISSMFQGLWYIWYD